MLTIVLDKRWHVFAWLATSSFSNLLSRITQTHTDLDMPSDSKLPPFDHEYSFSYTTPPNPVFNYGDPVSSTDLGKVWLEGLKEGWQVYDTTKTDTKYVYHLSLAIKVTQSRC